MPTKHLTMEQKYSGDINESTSMTQSIPWDRQLIGSNTSSNENTDIDSLLLIHRRKMLRRAANRRSAKLSRARKKAHMEDLKAENVRLQRIVDVLDSQPELLFCVTADGYITYMSEQALNHFRVLLTGESNEHHAHVSQILTLDSVNLLFDCIRYAASINENNIYQEFDQMPIVKEVYYHDSMGGCPVIGFLRVTKVIRKANDFDEIFQLGDDDNDSTGGGPPAKKAKKTAAPATATTSKKSGSASPRSATSTANNGAESLKCLDGGLDDNEYLSLFSAAHEGGSLEFFGECNGNDNSNSFEDQGFDSSSNKDANVPGQPDREEYVCVVRPAIHTMPLSSMKAYQVRQVNTQQLQQLMPEGLADSSQYQLQQRRDQFDTVKSEFGDGYSPSENSSNSQPQSSKNHSGVSSSETASDHNDSDFYT